MKELGKGVFGCASLLILKRGSCALAPRNCPCVKCTQGMCEPTLLDAHASHISSPLFCGLHLPPTRLFSPALPLNPSLSPSPCLPYTPACGLHRNLHTELLHLLYIANPDSPHAMLGVTSSALDPHPPWEPVTSKTGVFTCVHPALCTSSYHPLLEMGRVRP